MAAGFWTFGGVATNCCSMQAHVRGHFQNAVVSACAMGLRPMSFVPCCAISACEKGQQLQQALEFSAVMQQNAVLHSLLQCS